MRKILLVVAALLLASLAKAAVAADNAEHQSQNARKVVILLGAIGFDTAQAKELVETVKKSRKKGFYNLAERQYDHGTFSLRYTTKDKFFPDQPKQLELHYVPKDSRFEFEMGNKRVGVGYHYKW